MGAGVTLIGPLVVWSIVAWLLLVWMHSATAWDQGDELDDQIPWDELPWDDGDGDDRKVA